MLIFGALLLIYFFYLKFSGKSIEEEPDNKQNYILKLIGMTFLAGLICYILGCVWTWSNLGYSLQTGHKLTLGYEDGGALRHTKKASCNDTVMYFSFFLTFLPFILIIAIPCALILWKENCISEENAEEGVETDET